MRKRNSLTFIKDSSNNGNLKFKISLLLMIVMLGSIIFYSVFSYKIMMKNFISSFNSNNFSNANNLLLTTEKFNPFKSLLLEKDLSTYFSNKLEELSTMLSNGEISENDALNIMYEIQRYDIVSTDLDNSSATFNPNTSDAFIAALELFKNKKYKDAYSAFKAIDSSDSNYNSAKEYIDKCKSNLKADTLSKADELCTNDYYTKAIEEIEQYKSILGDDQELSKKIESIKKLRNDYLEKQNDITQQASASIVNSISLSTINQIGVESLTPYLLHVDLNNQKTYVYKGTKNNWDLLKTFDCSTGISNETTPTGVYTIKEKGKWFFSEKYQQGGKYWVQFYGDYLFHSLPYNKDQSKIVDYTLGKPASHGCIRLEENNSKWIYDNIPSGSKVVIK